jgi:DNA-binding transcriptional LysR family regulator
MAQPKTTDMLETHRSLEWSDLSVILAICRTGSIAGAARTLCKTRSTVFRNINAIEERLGVRFFDRHDSGYYMTDAERIAMETAEKVEAAVKALDVQVSGQDERRAGRVRMTCMDAFATDEAPAIVARFHEVHPDICIDVSPG